MQLQALFDWLAALSPAALLPALAVLAAIENIFPPIPADVLVAFGGFLAARANASPWPPFLAIWFGNIAGAMLMYALARRMGRDWIARRFHIAPGGANEARLTSWYATYGIAGLFFSRFLPGFRALVPPLAGALRFPPTGLLIAMAAASAVWYGAITWLSFSAGNNWSVVSARIFALGRWSGAIAAIVVVAIAVRWWVRRPIGR